MTSFGLIASGALLWLEPFIALGGAFSSFVQMLLVGGALVVFMAPTLITLASAPWAGRYLRMPILWPLPSVIAAICIVTSVPDDDGSWFWFILPYAFFSFIASSLGSLHILTRIWRFLFVDPLEVGKFEQGFSRLLYGAGTALASLSLIVMAIVTRGVPAGICGTLLLIYGVWIARGREVAEYTIAGSKRKRFVWLLGAAMTLAAGLAAYTVAIWIFVDDGIEYSMNTNGGWLLNFLFFVESIGVLLTYLFSPFDDETS